MATSNEPRHAAADMASGKRRSKVPAHWWDLVESQQAIARFDQATPTDEHTWRLVPMVAKPKLDNPKPVNCSHCGNLFAATGDLCGKCKEDLAMNRAVNATRVTPAPVAPPPKATVAKAPTPKATPAKAAMVTPAVATVAPKPTPPKPVGPRQLDPRLPPVGKVNSYTAKDGKVYTWKVINESGRVSLRCHSESSGVSTEPEEFSSVSSAAAKINHGTSTNGYLFFGLGKKA